MLDRDVSFVTTFESARFRLVTTPSMSACVIAPCSSNPETRRQTLRDGTLQGIDDGALCSQCHGGSGQGHARGGRGNRSCCGAGRPRHRRMLCHQVRADGRMLHRLRLQRLGRRQHVPHPQLRAIFLLRAALLERASGQRLGLGKARLAHFQDRRSEWDFGVLHGLVNVLSLHQDLSSFLVNNNQRPAHYRHKELARVCGQGLQLLRIEGAREYQRCAPVRGPVLRAQHARKDELLARMLRLCAREHQHVR